MSDSSRYRAENIGQLTGGQKKRFRFLTKALFKAVKEYTDLEQIAASSGKPKPDNQQSQGDPYPEIRPNNVFCIDGGRGSGKTHVLHTLNYFLECLMESPTQNILDSWDWEGCIPKEFHSRKTPLNLIAPLRIIFPGDLEKQELVMEAMFAAIDQDINRILNGIQEGSSTHEKGKKLKEQLKIKVAKGDYFAKRFGDDAVMRDSLNFDDLISNWHDLNNAAARRPEEWRQFIDDYLDWKGVETLAILLDDSDLKPEVTQDILQTARSMFNHPRLIAVIAGNTRSMRNSLLQIQMKALAKIMPALNKDNDPSGEYWRKTERQNVEQILEKVLPEAKRFYIPAAKASDFKTILEDKKKLDDIIEKQLNNGRDRFMHAKMLQAFQLEARGSDKPSIERQLVLEGYISWWIFQLKYKNKLRPHSARKVLGFGEYFAGEKDSEPGKRLAVALFDNAANYALLQRFEDEDDNVVEWLGRQNLGADWGHQRAFKVNGKRIESGTYSHEYICFRIDTGLALPLYRNQDSYVPEPLLPPVRGRRRIRQFYRPPNMPSRPRRLGVQRWIDHSAMPGNCFYFYHLHALPTIAFVPTEELKPRENNQGGKWEAEMFASWPRLLDRDQDEGLQKYYTRILQLIANDPENAPTTADLMLTFSEEPDGEDRYTKKLFHVLKSQSNSSVTQQAMSESFENEVFSVDGVKGSLYAKTEAFRRAYEKACRLGYKAAYKVAKASYAEKYDEAYVKSNKASHDPAYDPAYDAARDKAYATAIIESQSKPEAEAAKEAAVEALIKKRTRAEIRTLAKDDTKAGAEVQIDADFHRYRAQASAMATDLRRAWHAIRVWDVSRGRDHEDSDDTATMLSLSAKERAGDRMRLYTFEQLKKKLCQDDWVKGMIEIFSDFTRTKAGDPIGVEKSKPHGEGENEPVCPEDIIVKISDLNYNFPDNPKEDKGDFESEIDEVGEAIENIDDRFAIQSIVWTNECLKIGRKLCNYWTIGVREEDNNWVDQLYDGTSVHAKYPSNRENYRIRVFGTDHLNTDEETCNSDKKTKLKEAELKKFRSARAFIWLLYGIAPSLPAMIHADVTSRYVDGTDENIRDCEDALNDWNELILLFTLILQYLRYKCIVIYGVSSLYHLLVMDENEQKKIYFDSFKDPINKAIRKYNDDHKKKENEKISELEEPKDLEECLRGFWLEKHDDGYRSISKKALEDRLKSDRDSKKISDPTLSDLSLLPDTCPSTLFGDGWLAETITTWKLGGEKRLTGENRGVFGETEQWLWASHRMIRQLWQTFDSPPQK